MRRSHAARYLLSLAAPLLLGPACDGAESTSDTDGETEEPVDRPEPLPYDPEYVPQPPSASLTPEDAATLAPELIGILASHDVAQFIARYEQFMLHADETCPGVYVAESLNGYETSYQWSLNECYSLDGTHFQGGLTYVTYDAHPTDDGAMSTGLIFSATGFAITLPEGDSFQGAVYMQRETLAYPDFVVDNVYSSGYFRADETSAAGNPWLTGAVTGNLGRYTEDTAAGRKVSYSGSVNLIGYDPLAAFSGSINVDNYECPLKVTGAVALRDKVGAWHDIDFGPIDVPNEGASCDACGDLSMGDELIGPFCPDETVFAGMLAW